MSLRLNVRPHAGPVPTMQFAWNAETRILSGAFPVPAGSGFTGSVEITGDDGAILVLDAAGGWLRGFEIVVWPGAEVESALDVPLAAPARVAVSGEMPAGGVGAAEIETVIEADVTPDRDVIHVLVGPDDPVQTVQVADHMLVEFDAEGRLAGLWLDQVPPAPGRAA